MELEKAYQKITALCARREYCCSDIRAKLLKWELEAGEVEQLMQQLIQQDFINEGRYAGVYVRDKARFNKWGPTKIIWNLRQKGLSEEVIKDALATLEEDVFGSQLEQGLRQKLRLLRQDDPYKRKQALLRFGASRGFAFEEIAAVLDRLKAEGLL
ncbi:regulatory protein RecX [Geofilum rhodophaeum]|uniref:regulatory protein RecX n=1 Tax=Geofilum rhodophaeum TaxID=1965019 RepID=UPI000B524BB0|nr:regulatory protein RecX [Geofilum rhodophaeum]